eukprot:4986070-Amphidinium_carterae.1
MLHCAAHEVSLCACSVAVVLVRCRVQPLPSPPQQPTRSVQLGTNPPESRETSCNPSITDTLITNSSLMLVREDYVAPYLPQIMFLIPLLLFLRAMSGGMGGPSGMSGMGG